MEFPDLLAPLDEATFAALAQELVNDTAPRVFALLAEDGERQNGCVAAWGLAFEDRAVLIADGPRTLFMIFDSPQRALSRLSTLGPMRLIWPDPHAAPTHGGVDTSA